MKLISWNVNGLRACAGKGFFDFFKAEDADIFCLGETKMQPDQADFDFAGYHQYWNSAAARLFRRRCLHQSRAAACLLWSRH